MEFSKLERAAIEAILSKEVDGMEVVREQFAAASVVERDYTGVGFYTKISVPLSMSPMPDSKALHDALFIGACAAANSESPNVISFILRTHGGYLACLEGVTSDSSWPNEDDIGDVGPAMLRKPVGKHSSADGLMPDCERRFEYGRPTGWAVALFAVLIVIVVTLVGILLALAGGAR